MAFPKLLTKLFQNDGAGSMLRTDIIPTDSSLSSTSTNAIQNKVVTSAFASANEYADSTGYQVGDFKLYAGSNVPDGWFRCDGSTIADMATNYPKLYAVLGTNVLPNCSDRVPMGASSGINTIVTAGLPNITGSLIGNSGSSSAWLALASAGAFVDWTGPSAIPAGIFNPSHTYPLGATAATKLDASHSNTIYGASSTVQPPAVKVAFLIKHD